MLTKARSNLPVKCPFYCIEEDDCLVGMLDDNACPTVSDPTLLESNCEQNGKGVLKTNTASEMARATVAC